MRQWHSPVEPVLVLKHRIRAVNVDEACYTDKAHCDRKNTGDDGTTEPDGKHSGQHGGNEEDKEQPRFEGSVVRVTDTDVVEDLPENEQRERCCAPSKSSKIFGHFNADLHSAAQRTCASAARPATPKCNVVD